MQQADAHASQREVALVDTKVMHKGEARFDPGQPARHVGKRGLLFLGASPWAVIGTHHVERGGVQGMPQSLLIGGAAKGRGANEEMTLAS